MKYYFVISDYYKGSITTINPCSSNFIDLSKKYFKQCSAGIKLLFHENRSRYYEIKHFIGNKTKIKTIIIDLRYHACPLTIVW